MTIHVPAGVYASLNGSGHGFLGSAVLWRLKKLQISRPFLNWTMDGSRSSSGPSKSVLGLLQEWPSSPKCNRRFVRPWATGGWAARRGRIRRRRRTSVGRPEAGTRRETPDSRRPPHRGKRRRTADSACPRKSPVREKSPMAKKGIHAMISRRSIVVSLSTWKDKEFRLISISARIRSGLGRWPSLPLEVRFGCCIGPAGIGRIRPSLPSLRRSSTFRPVRPAAVIWTRKLPANGPPEGSMANFPLTMSAPAVGPVVPGSGLNWMLALFQRPTIEGYGPLDRHASAVTASQQCR